MIVLVYRVTSETAVVVPSGFSEIAAMEMALHAVKSGKIPERAASCTLLAVLPSATTCKTDTV